MERLDIASVRIGLASPDKIRSLSKGVVKKAETINYRTLKPERDGLFCERIFGPKKDYECACGKYKGIKYKGMVCDRCGVEVESSRIRRERMGHIELAVPVAHIWFYANIPSRIGLILDLSINDVRSVIYYERIIVIEMNYNLLKEVDKNIPRLLRNKLRPKDVYPEEIFWEILEDVCAEAIRIKYPERVLKLRQEFLEKQETEKETGEFNLTKAVKENMPEIFDSMFIKLTEYVIDVEKKDKTIGGTIKPGIVYGTGAYAIKKLLQQLDIDAEIRKLREIMHEKGMKTDKRILKRLSIFEDLKNSGNKPEWMIMDVIPVIPPELRPMVQLEGGRFATSDLNDLYRRVINRNNRLRRLQQLKAPEIIIRNEKRMLQESVDALFDNSRKKRVVKGQGNRPLKSLSDMLKGKQGRFRQNLLGKRVDYSGRSVIVVGPELKLHQVGIPKIMALELFKPFVMKALKERGITTNIKFAKRLIEEEDERVWEVLEDVVKNHPVFINRAPTLHRLSIQAFEPVLVEGKAIKLHPLVCKAFNADFDGDQMAVHVPLSIEAQIENWMLMLSSNNLLSPANGRPIVIPTQDIVLGVSYLTKVKPGAKGEGKIFATPEEVLKAVERNIVDLNAKIKVKIKGNIIETTPGRIIFNEVLPEDYPFVNRYLTSKSLSQLIAQLYKKYGKSITAQTLDKLKEVGFHYATVYGVTIGLDDLIVPEEKQEIINKAKKEVEKVEESYRKGIITNSERYNQIIDIWIEANEELTSKMLERMEKDKDGFNPVYIMAESGARGNKQQIRQLSGMRGLMAKPSGEIIELPILSNFKEGLTVLEYFISTHGARKGLADTALKTANAGYLTRRLIDVAQDVVVTIDDCGTINGREVVLASTEEEDIELFKQKIIGRVALEDVIHPVSGEVIVEANKLITDEIADKIVNTGIERVKIRSVITCEAKYGVCRMCYGTDCSTGELVEKGEAVGIVAAQSIGEPGTQLTLRTFHIGGTAHTEFEETQVKYGYHVYIVNIPKHIITAKDGSRIVSRRGEIKYQQIYHIWKESELEPEVKLNSRVGPGVKIGRIKGKKESIMAEYIGKFKKIKDFYVVVSDEKIRKLKIGSKIYVKKGEIVPPGKLIAEFNPFFEPIITEHSGTVVLKDVIPGQTLREEIDEEGVVNKIIIKSKEEKALELQPRIGIKKEDGKIEYYIPPYGAHLIVEDGQKVEKGDILAKIPEKISKTKDITGGLPRVEELFEARRPKDCAVVTEIDGRVELAGIVKNKRIIKVKDEQTGEERKYLVPIGRHLLVHEGDMVSAGDPLDDGPIDPHDILRIKGEQALHNYLLEEIQNVYRLQGVEINDKHIEVILRQMLNRVEITDAGDTRFIVGAIVTRHEFREENERVIKEGGKPATAKPTLLGITKAALTTESFISAASFQETTRVLTNAAIKGKIDYLRGLKENVIIGHLIPAGTGLREYNNLTIDIEKKMEELMAKELQKTKEEKIIEEPVSES